MAHIIREEKVLRLSVFVILFPIENYFFVWKTEEDNLKQIYKGHYYGDRASTKELFAKAKKRNEVPPMYCLETLETTEKEAFIHCVAWAKYFLEQGFNSCCGKIIDKHTGKLQAESQKLYDEIRDAKMDEVCPPEEDLFPKFGSEKAKDGKDSGRRITFRVTKEEHQKIKSAAEETGITATEYCKKMILNGRIVEVESGVFNAFSEYINEFVTRDQLLKNILSTIYATKKYYPKDLEIIQKAVSDNKAQQDKAIEEIKLILEQLME